MKGMTRSQLNKELDKYRNERVPTLQAEVAKLTELKNSWKDRWNKEIEVAVELQCNIEALQSQVAELQKFKDYANHLVRLSLHRDISDYEVVTGMNAKLTGSTEEDSEEILPDWNMYTPGTVFPAHGEYMVLLKSIPEMRYPYIAIAHYTYQEGGYWFVQDEYGNEIRITDQVRAWQEPRVQHSWMFAIEEDLET